MLCVFLHYIRVHSTESLLFARGSLCFSTFDEYSSISATKTTRTPALSCECAINSTPSFLLRFLALCVSSLHLRFMYNTLNHLRIHLRLFTLLPAVSHSRSVTVTSCSTHSLAWRYWPSFSTLTYCAKFSKPMNLCISFNFNHELPVVQQFCFSCNIVLLVLLPFPFSSVAHFAVSS